MTYTEEEAKTKVCPIIANGTGSKCIASACMAWRAGQSHWKDNMGKHFTSREDAFGRGDRTYTEIRRGFCGLAGQPNG